MDYVVEIEKLEKFLREEYFREAARNAGAILESALRENYLKVRSSSSPETLKVLLTAEEKIGKGKSDFKSFTLGQIVGLYREGKVFSISEVSLGLDCKLAKRIPLDELTLFRNKVIHEDFVPSLDELLFFVSNLKVVLKELCLIESFGKDSL